MTDYTHNDITFLQQYTHVLLVSD